MIFALLFMGVTAFIVYNGVEGGIEKVSKIMMPILLVLVVVIAVYSLTLQPHRRDRHRCAPVFRAFSITSLPTWRD